MGSRRAFLARVRRVAELWVSPEAPSPGEISRIMGVPVYQVSRDIDWLRRHQAFACHPPSLAPAGTGRNRKLEETLRTAFGLPHAVVVTEGPGGSESRQRLPGGGTALSDLIGRIAGSYLARELPAGATIAFGAGGTVYATGRTLGLLAGNAGLGRIRGLAGHGRAVTRLWVGPYARQSLDVCRVLESLFEAYREAEVFPLYEPLVQPSPAAVMETIERRARWLLREAWEEGRVEAAIVGMGVMGPAHTLNRTEEREVGPIRALLGQLRRLCGSFEERRGFCPVADIADQLFSVVGPEDHPGFCDAALPLIGEINDHRLGAGTGLFPAAGTSFRTAAPAGGPVASLLSAGRIVLVAGGAAKVRPLLTLLRTRRADGGSYLDTLVTDRRTAAAVVDLPAGRRRGVASLPAREAARDRSARGGPSRDVSS